MSIPAAAVGGVLDGLGLSSLSRGVHHLGENEMQYYRKKGTTPMRAYVEGESLDPCVSVGSDDKANGSPKVGDMIAMDPNNAADQWLVSKAYFEANYEPA